MSDRPPITTHILDLVNGRPAAGVVVRLYREAELLARGVTNDDGRVESWSEALSIDSGKYRLEFDVEPWFTSRGEKSFYEDVHISFRIVNADEHYHVPLLLSPFGYSTYRGS